MKIILGAIAAASIALVGAPTAAADINIGGVNLHIGKGTAEASPGNIAIARKGGTASAVGGVANIAVARGPKAVASVTGPGGFNTAIASGKGSEANIDSSAGFNVAIATHGGHATIDRSTPDTYSGSVNVVIAGRDATAHATDTQLSVSVALCGGSVVTAQSQRVKVSAPCH